MSRQISRPLILSLLLALLLSSFACSSDESAPPVYGVNNADTPGNNTDAPNNATPNNTDAPNNNTTPNNTPNNTDAPDMNMEDVDETDADMNDMALPSPDMPDQDAGDISEDMNDMPDQDAGDMPDLPGGECDPVAQDCPNNEGGDDQRCIPIEGVPTCVRTPENPLGEDESCGGGDCGEGLTCINWGGSRGQVCTRFCDREDHGTCPEDKSCSSWIQSNPSIGLCSPRRTQCDIYSQDCEGDNQACTLGRDPENNDPIFVCSTAGPQEEGQPCSNGNGNCNAGMICIRQSDTESFCHKVCEGDEACGLDRQTCSGRSTTWGVTFCR